MRLLIIAIFFALLLGCERDNYCLECVTYHYRSEAEPLNYGGWLYFDYFIRSETTMECSQDYIGPYTINGAAKYPSDGREFFWTYKVCE